MTDWRGTELSIDETQWPIVTVRWSGAPSDQEVQRILRQMDQWLARRERFGLLLDSRGASGLSPEQRNEVVGYMKQHASLTAPFLVQAIVIDNLIQRTLFYGINLIFPNQFESKVFSDPASARRWLGAVLGKD